MAPPMISPISIVTKPPMTLEEKDDPVFSLYKVVWYLPRDMNFRHFPQNAFLGLFIYNYIEKILFLLSLDHLKKK